MQLVRIPTSSPAHHSPMDNHGAFLCIQITKLALPH
nr:MAG TPA: hypothetical protein [Caudoviricetes sp.]